MLLLFKYRGIPRKYGKVVRTRKPTTIMYMGLARELYSWTHKLTIFPR